MALAVKEKKTFCQCRRCKRPGFNPWVGKIPWRRAQQPTLVFLPGESHGQMSLVCYSPWGLKESDMTKATCRAHIYNLSHLKCFPSGSVVKNPPEKQEIQESWVWYLCGKDRLEEEMANPFHIPVFLPGQSYGQRSLAGYSPWDCKELDTTEQLNTRIQMHYGRWRNAKKMGFTRELGRISGLLGMPIIMTV